MRYNSLDVRDFLHKEGYKKFATNILNLPWEFDMVQCAVIPSDIDGHQNVLVSGVGTKDTAKHIEEESHFELGGNKHLDAVNKNIDDPNKFMQEKYLTKPLDGRVTMIGCSWNDEELVQLHRIDPDCVQRVQTHEAKRPIRDKWNADHAEWKEINTSKWNYDS